MIPSVTDFLHRIEDAGYCLFPDVVPGALLVRLRQDIPKRQEQCRYWQKKNGMEAGLEGAAHHIAGGDDSLAEFLESFFLDDYITAYFDGPYILNSYGAYINSPGDAYQHGHKYHRDVRTFSNGFRLMLNMLVMVDAFTEENGATKVIPGSHRTRERPSDEELETRSVRVTGSAGSIVLFDSNLWHSAAPNRSDKPRIALTPTFSRPFFKQQIDYPRLLGEDYPKNDKLRQLYGYNARVPVNHDEWYQPPERRKYKPGQG